jgi:hypothetical protein
MSALSIQPTYPIFTDIDGQPLEAGYVWIGTANLDPQTNPITVYWDAALTILAPQPIRTLAGYPSNNGTPARLYVNSDYSIRVMNKNGSTLYSAPEANEIISSDFVTFLQTGVGAVERSVQSKLEDEKSAKDFGAQDGITSDSAAIQAAIDDAFAAGGGEVVLPRGLYNLGTTGIKMKDRVILRGLGSINFGNDSNAQVQSGVILQYTGSGYAVSFGDGTYNCYGAAMKNIGVYGDATGANGILIRGVTGGASVGTMLQDVLVNNFADDGITCGPFAFIGDFIHVNVRNVTTGFNLASENNRYNFLSCDVNMCTTGFLLGSGSGTIQSGIELFGGRVENCAVGVQVSAPSRVVGIFGIYIESFSQRGILCNTAGQTVSIIGSTINGSSPLGSCIAIFNGGFCNIIGNEFSGSMQNEIDLGSAAVYGVVKGNRHSAAVTGSRMTAPVAGSIIELNTTYAGGGAVHETHDYKAGTFTPTWQNLTVGDAPTNTGFWVKIGAQVTVGVHLVFGSTTAVTGNVSVTNLPFTADRRAFGTGNLLDAGTDNFVARTQASESSTSLFFNAQDASGTYLKPTNLSATIPHTWAVTDEIRGNCVYTTAS